MEQNSREWNKARLGMFTSSKISNLFKKGKGKDEYFGVKALSYIHEKAAERKINPIFIERDDYFEAYMSRVEVRSKNFDWGHQNEPIAADVYAEQTELNLVEIGFVRVDDYFGDSPDRLVVDKEGVIIGTLEIKCPITPVSHLQFCLCENSQDVKEINEDYYYQCHGHIYANNAEWCDFISFDYMCQEPMKIIRFERDETVINEMKERIQKASIILETILNK